MEIALPREEGVCWSQPSQRQKLRLGSIAVVASAISVLGTSQVGRGAVSCGAWSVGGIWTTRQSNTGPAVTFNFRQDGSAVRGSAMVGPASEDFHGTLSGTIEGDKLMFIVTEQADE